jgi:hypothetical protein
MASAGTILMATSTVDLFPPPQHAPAAMEHGQDLALPEHSTQPVAKTVSVCRHSITKDERLGRIRERAQNDGRRGRFQEGGRKGLGFGRRGFTPLLQKRCRGMWKVFPLCVKLQPQHVGPDVQAWVIRQLGLEGLEDLPIHGCSIRGALLSN